MAEARGVTLRFARHNLPGREGLYVRGTNEAWIDASIFDRGGRYGIDSRAVEVVVHELTHHLDDAAPELASEIRQIIGPEILSRAADEYIEDWAYTRNISVEEARSRLSDDHIARESLARAMEYAFGEKYRRMNADLWSKFKEAIRSILAKFGLTNDEINPLLAAVEKFESFRGRDLIQDQAVADESVSRINDNIRQSSAYVASIPGVKTGVIHPSTPLTTSEIVRFHERIRSLITGPHTNPLFTEDVPIFNSDISFFSRHGSWMGNYEPNFQLSFRRGFDGLSQTDAVRAYGAALGMGLAQDAFVVIKPMSEDGEPVPAARILKANTNDGFPLPPPSIRDSDMELLIPALSEAKLDYSSGEHGALTLFYFGPDSAYEEWVARIKEVVGKTGLPLEVKNYLVNSELHDGSRDYRKNLGKIREEAGSTRRPNLVRAAFNNILAPALRVYAEYGFGFDASTYIKYFRLNSQEREILARAIERTPFGGAKNVGRLAGPEIPPLRRFIHFSKGDRTKTGITRDHAGKGVTGTERVDIVTDENGMAIPEQSWVWLYTPDGEIETDLFSHTTYRMHHVTGRWHLLDIRSPEYDEIWLRAKEIDPSGTPQSRRRVVMEQTVLAGYDGLIDTNRGVVKLYRDIPPEQISFDKPDIDESVSDSDQGDQQPVRRKLKPSEMADRIREVAVEAGRMLAVQGVLKGREATKIVRQAVMTLEPSLPVDRVRKLAVAIARDSAPNGKFDEALFEQAATNVLSIDSTVKPRLSLKSIINLKTGVTRPSRTVSERSALRAGISFRCDAICVDI